MYYTAKVNVIDPIKDNITKSLGIKNFLGELEVPKNDYYISLSISKNEDLELPLKRECNLYFANNYFDVGLKALQANMDIQLVFNE